MICSSTIEEILSPLGYQVQYVKREKYPGSDPTILCIAIKGGLKHYAFKVCPPDHPDHHRRIRNIEDATPRMAKIVGPIEDVVLSVEAWGENLWGVETPPNPRLVEAQLAEFALWTQTHQLIHGDLRPWNVFLDNDHGVQVIDWSMLSSFVDDLLPRGELPPRRNDLLGDGHYAKFHSDLVAQGKYTEIDRCDAQLIGSLLRGEIGLAEAWPKGSHPSRRPSWCRP